MRIKNSYKISFILVVLVTIIAVFPLVVMISFSLRSRSEVFSSILLPVNPTVKNYETILKDKLLMRYILNSIFLSSSIAFISILFGTLTGYGFSRYRFKGKNTILLLLIGTQMLPPVLVAVGFFQLIVKLGLYDNIFGHFFPPFDTERDCHKPFAICLKLYYTCLFRNVNHPKG